MSHRKVNSQGSIPFSWEDSPGISKFIHLHNSAPDDHTGPHALSNLSSSSPMGAKTLLHESSSDSSSATVIFDHHHHHGSKIPLPPCPKFQPPQRSASAKGLMIWWWQEDPFLAAYKECTKNERAVTKPEPAAGHESKKRCTGTKVRKTKLIFSCKTSCDVDDDNLVVLSSLPTLPKGRVRRM